MKSDMSKFPIRKYLDLYGDGIHGTPEYDDYGEYYFINGNNIKNGKIVIDDTTLKISNEVYNKIKRPLNDNTLLMSINGTLGNIGVYNGEKVALGKSACFLNVKEGCNKYFVKYLLSTKEFQKYITLVAHGSTIKNLAPSQIADYIPELPDEINVDRIAEQLKSIDDKIENNSKIIEILELMAKTLYDYWFVQFDFLDENGHPYKTSGGKMEWNETLSREIPIGWEVNNLFHIASYVNGFACQKYRPVEDEDSLPVIKIREMHEGIRPDTERVSIDIPLENIIDDGDILFSWSATLEIQYWTGGKGGLNQHIFKVIPKDNFPKEYVYHQLQEYVVNFVKIAEARKTTMGHITQDHLDFSRIPIPPFAILERFAEKIHPIHKQMILCSQENRRLINLRDFLLPMLMNGQVTFRQ